VAAYTGNEHNWRKDEIFYNFFNALGIECVSFGLTSTIVSVEIFIEFDRAVQFRIVQSSGRTIDAHGPLTSRSDETLVFLKRLGLDTDKVVLPISVLFE
jgi:hypothetical protein